MPFYVQESTNLYILMPANLWYYEYVIFAQFKPDLIYCGELVHDLGVFKYSIRNGFKYFLLLFNASANRENGLAESSFI